MKLKDSHFFVEMIIVFVTTLGMPLPCESDTAWLAGWKYRIPVVINNDGANLHDYQVQVNFDRIGREGGHTLNFARALPCGDDLRVTDSDGVTGFDFWIETWDAKAERASIWIKIPALTDSSERIIFLYYGNPEAASTGNGAAVFPVLFDDFSDDLPGCHPHGWEVSEPENTSVAVFDNKLLSFSPDRDNPIDNLKNMHSFYAIWKDGEYQAWCCGIGKVNITIQEKHDEIFYTTSPDGKTWSDPVPVRFGEKAYLPRVKFIDGKYRMWYVVSVGPGYKLRYAESSKSNSGWKVHGDVVTGSEWYDDRYGTSVGSCDVLYEDDVYQMWYTAIASTDDHFRIAYATSTDGIEWTKHGIALDVPDDTFGISKPCVVKDDGTYYLYYSKVYPTGAGYFGIGAAKSADSGRTFTVIDSNPNILSLGHLGRWDDSLLSYPEVNRDNGDIMWFRGRQGNIEYIGLANPDYDSRFYGKSVILCGDGSAAPFMKKVFPEQFEDFIFETRVKVDRRNRAFWIDLCDVDAVPVHCGFWGIGYFTWYSPNPKTAHYISAYEPARLYRVKYVVKPFARTYDIYIDDMKEPKVKDAEFFSSGTPDEVRYSVDGSAYGTDLRAMVNVNFIRSYTENEPSVSCRHHETAP